MTTTTPALAELRANPDNSSWLAALEGAGPVTTPPQWPGERAFVEILRFFEIPDEDIVILQGLYPAVTANPDLRWIVDRYVQLLRNHMDDPGYRPLPELPGGFGDLGPHLFTIVHAAILPEVLALHRRRGIPDEISRATMADIGRHYVIRRTEEGTSGLNGGARWLTFHARGLLFQLGRLQFERAPLGNRTSQSIREAGVSAEKGEPVLAVHIPGFMGPFPRDACDESFRQAREFFPRHFPETRFRFATCHSWLLDEQLAEYLPETSNIVQFQRRFRPGYRPDADNEGTLGFVFRSPGRSIDDLPQDTTLERAVVRHIREGNHWHGGSGWLEL